MKMKKDKESASKKQRKKKISREKAGGKYNSIVRSKNTGDYCTGAKIDGGQGSYKILLNNDIGFHTIY